MKYYYSIRVVEANSREEAIEKVQNQDFCEDHSRCDDVVLADNVTISDETISVEDTERIKAMASESIREYLQDTKENISLMAFHALEAGGDAALDDLHRALTEKFCLITKENDTDFGQVDFFDNICTFLEREEKISAEKADDEIVEPF